MVWICSGVSMYNASVAEWVLARFMSKSRAASIVGDLLELEPQKGKPWFWLVLCRVVFTHVWRRPLAFITAFYAGMWALDRFQMAIYGIHAQHRPPESWITMFGLVCDAGIFTIFVLAYGVIRYGPRDRVTQLALLWTVPTMALIYLWWRPVILVSCIFLSVCAAAASTSSPESRRAALVLFVVVVAGFGGSLLALYLSMQYQHFLYPGPMGDREMREHPSIGWVSLCLLLMTASMMTTAFSRMHDWLTRDKSLDLESEQLR
jgi:hypothetical protein